MNLWWREISALERKWAEKLAERDKTNTQLSTALMQLTAENIIMREALEWYRDIQDNPSLLGHLIFRRSLGDVATAALAQAAEKGSE